MLCYEKNRTTLTVTLSGELDQREAADIRAQLDALLEDGQIRRLIFDLSLLRFMDSSGIGLIIGRYKRLRPRNGSVAVRGASERMCRIMDMAGLFQLVERLA